MRLLKRKKKNAQPADERSLRTESQPAAFEQIFAIKMTPAISRSAYIFLLKP